MRTYAIKEIFGPTLQGEGGMTGTVCHFLRFTGCNMWNGLEEYRADSQCPFCDTQFRGGERLTAEQIVARLRALGRVPWVTITGGEPMLQLDGPLARALHTAGWKLAIETNGTIPIPYEVDHVLSHVTLSPKLPRPQIKVRRCDSLKLLYPHPNPLIRPEAFLDIEAKDRYLQPITPLDGSPVNFTPVINRLLTDLPDWRLSVQMHKIIGVE